MDWKDGAGTCDGFSDIGTAMDTLQSIGVCRDDGTIHPTARRFITMAALAACDVDPFEFDPTLDQMEGATVAGAKRTADHVDKIVEMGYVVDSVVSQAIDKIQEGKQIHMVKDDVERTIRDGLRRYTEP
jgi:hypothetical protein